MKYEAFLKIARNLNEMGVVPLLFGSLGLERRLGMDLRADDIDILIPRRYLAEHWPALRVLMEEMGYRLYDLHEHAFSNGEVSAAFASLEGLAAFAGVEIPVIPQITDKGTDYLLLGLEDYRKVYLASSKDGYRRDVKNKDDLRKVELIDRAKSEG